MTEFSSGKKRPAKMRGAKKIRFSFLLSSGLYRRYGNFTRSGVYALRRLYCRWGIAPRPKENSVVTILYHEIEKMQVFYRKNNIYRFCRHSRERRPTSPAARAAQGIAI